MSEAERMENRRRTQARLVASGTGLAGLDLSQGVEPQREVPTTDRGHGEAAAIADLHTYRAARDSRDDVIRKAYLAGVSEALIAKLTGHSRTTVHSILNR